MATQVHTHLSNDVAQHQVDMRNYFVTFFLCFFAFLGAGCKGTFPDRALLESPGAGQPVYKLGPGDKIRVTVYEYPDLSGSFTVDDTGRISLPLIRGINVKGLAIPELEQIIAERLSINQIIDPKVSIDLMGTRPFCVLGEVRNPGCFSYVFGMTASMAIAFAGSYTYRAKQNEFVITREDGRKVAGDQNTPIYVGDVIEVFERLF